jgi:hypothetical protein
MGTLWSWSAPENNGGWTKTTERNWRTGPPPPGGGSCAVIVLAGVAAAMTALPAIAQAAADSLGPWL